MIEGVRRIRDMPAIPERAALARRLGQGYPMATDGRCSSYRESGHRCTRAKHKGSFHVEHCYSDGNSGPGSKRGDAYAYWFGGR